MQHVIIAEKDRPNFLPTLVANNLMAMMAYEGMVFSTMSKFTKAYNGGMWDFVEFEGGGKAMILPQTFVVACHNHDNYFEGKMSIRSLSLACNLMVASHLSFQVTGQCQDNLSENYHLLREVSFEHEWFKAESGLIARLLD